VAHVYFQASLVAERQGHWVRARSYAEKAKALYEELADRQSVGRLLNNLGGLTFLLGRPDEAVEHLKSAFSHALEVGSSADAAQAISSLAQVHLRTGDRAAEQARRAPSCSMGGSTPDEIGNAQLVLGRPSRAARRSRRRREAERNRAASSGSHRAAWIAQGDLATQRGRPRAARLYRHAAETSGLL
jgi:tetratricopeptide (TPR) repeat protein